MSDSSGEMANVLARLGDVESLLMFLQRTTDDLNQVILEQQRRLNVQEKDLSRLRAMLDGLTDSIVELPRRPEDEKPPHY